MPVLQQILLDENLKFLRVKVSKKNWNKVVLHNKIKYLQESDLMISEKWFNLIDHTTQILVFLIYQIET